MVAGDGPGYLYPNPSRQELGVLELTSMPGCCGPCLALHGQRLWTSSDPGVAPGDGLGGEVAPSGRALTLAGRFTREKAGTPRTAAGMPVRPIGMLELGSREERSLGDRQWAGPPSGPASPGSSAEGCLQRPRMEFKSRSTVTHPGKPRPPSPNS